MKNLAINHWNALKKNAPIVMNAAAMKRMANVIADAIHALAVKQKKDLINLAVNKNAKE
jgi:hypothetical protein